MILLPFPIFAPKIIRFTDTKEENKENNGEYQATNNEEKIEMNETDVIGINKNKKIKKFSKKMEGCSDYWHKCLLFIGVPCIKYAYYLVNRVLCL